MSTDIAVILWAFGAIFYTMFAFLIGSFPAYDVDSKTHARWQIACVAWPVAVPIALLWLAFTRIPPAVRELWNEAFPKHAEQGGVISCGEWHVLGEHGPELMLPNGILKYTGVLSEDAANRLKAAFSSEPTMPRQDPTPGRWEQPK